MDLDSVTMTQVLKSNEPVVRRHVRGSLAQDTWAEIDGQGFSVLNISASGVLLGGPSIMRKGDVAEIRLRLPARDLHMLGMVTRLEAGTEERRTAFEFVDSSADEMALLSGTVDVALHAPQRLGRPHFVLLDPGRCSSAALIFAAGALECGVVVSMRASPHPIFGVVVTLAADTGDMMDVFVHALRQLPFAVCALYSNVCRPSPSDLARVGAQMLLRADGLESAMARLLVDARFRHGHRPNLGQR